MSNFKQDFINEQAQEKYYIYIFEKHNKSR